MRQAELLETSLTGERKVKLFRLLDDVLPHSDAPDVPDFLRLKAFHQLAIRINHNVKTRAGHIHHRKRERPPPQADSSPVANVENAQVGSGSQQVPSTPGMPYPNPPPFLTPPYRAPNPLGWPMPQSEGHVNGLSNHTDIGNIVLYCERQDKSQSVCSVKNLAPNNTPPGAPTDINNLTLGPWKSILVKDGVMRSPNDLITWHWGERRVKVSNDRVFRLVIEFMANHGGFIDFGVEAAKGGMYSPSSAGRGGQACLRGLANGVQKA